ncbi:neuropeptide-like 3 [Diabrotica virgifera virgifera]|uniref:Neuropeptide-like 3 n=1 Tax=Diabrotica virgifera virgifera TaxID=50390 RepID=A0A6P7FT47_DIAVI|nr:neuropeptide-like 3 [Diabrotica virgifera virgifera]
MVTSIIKFDCMSQNVLLVFKKLKILQYTKMFKAVFLFFAMLAVAFAAPRPAPAPQLLAYSAPAAVVSDVTFTGYPAVAPVYSAGVAPVAYSAPLVYY